MKKLITILLSICMLFALVGCSNGTENPEETADETQHWGFIFEQLTNPNYVTMSNVSKEYGASKGIDVQIYDGQEDNDKIVSAAENMATQGFEVILLSPMAVEVVATATEAAKAINPDIIVVNSANYVEECDYSLLQDDYTSGVVSGECLGNWMKENGHTSTLLLGAPRDQALIDRENGYLDGLKNVFGDEYDNLEIVNIDVIPFVSDLAAMSENLMQTYPDIRAVYAISDVVMSYYYEALLASGKDTSEFALYSVDGTLDSVRWIYENKGYKGSADTGTLEIPQGMIDSALMIQSGKSAADISIKLPVTMIDASNVDEYAKKIGYEE